VTLRRILLVLAGGATSLALVVSAGATTTGAPNLRHFPGPITAVALDGSRVAYAVGSSAKHQGSQVFVWNIATGKTTKVSGRQTYSWPSGPSKLALTAAQVAWIVRAGSNTSSTDILFTSLSTRPEERKVAQVNRARADCGSMGPRCAGDWIGGLVSSGNEIFFNRYTTTSHGFGKVDGIVHAVTRGALYALNGTNRYRFVAGTYAVEAVAADPSRVAVLKPNGGVHVFSTDGASLLYMTPTPRAAQVALDGRYMLVLKYGGTLELYNWRIRNIRKSFKVAGDSKLVQNLGMEGDIAIYTTGTGFGLGDFSHSTLHAVNLDTGKDRVIGKFGPGTGDVIGKARIGTAGVVYTSSSYSDNGRLVFLPWATVSAVVR